MMMSSGRANVNFRTSSATMTWISVSLLDSDDQLDFNAEIERIGSYAKRHL